jgi:hypothetical protein
MKTGGRPGKREEMIREMVRGLKTNGQLALAEFIFTGQLIHVFENTRMLSIKRVPTGRLSFLDVGHSFFGF